MSAINRSWKYRRTAFNDREKAFAESWEKENVPQHGLNYGHGILQDLFFTGSPWFSNLNSRAKAIKIISRRERMIVATVIQWLGTNCGWCFLEETLRSCGYRIEKIIPSAKTPGSRGEGD